MRLLDKVEGAAVLFALMAMLILEAGWHKLRDGAIEAFGVIGRTGKIN